MESGSRASVSDDEDSLLAELEAASQSSARLRLKLGSKKQPEVIRTENVFGTPNKSAVLRSNSQVASMLRERKKRIEAEKSLAELRKEVEAKGTRHAEDIVEFVPVASAKVEPVEKPESPRQEANSVFAYFLALPNWPRFSDVSFELEQDNHPLIDYMRKTGLPEAKYAPCLEFIVRHCKELGPFPDSFVRMLFCRCVYDSSYDDVCTTGRTSEMKVLLDYIVDLRLKDSSCMKRIMFPNMLNVLSKFGWISSDGDAGSHGRTADDVYPECLDGQVLHCEKSFDIKLMKSIRNLGRAFSIWSHMVKSNYSLEHIYGDSAIAIDSSKNLDYQVVIVKLCAQVLLTPFGCRLQAKVGELICAVLERIPEERWGSMRRRLACDIMDVSPIFELQERIASCFQRLDSIRTRALGLDFSFMLLKVWHSGFVSIPDAARFQWPEVSNERILSFSFVDVVTLLEKFPTISKQTNSKWASLWAMLLKDGLLMDSLIIDTIQGDECVRFQKAMKNIKRCSHRLPFGIDSKNFTLAIDSALIVFCSFVKAQKPSTELLKGGIGLGVHPRNSPGAFGQPRKRQKKVTDFFTKSPS